jgi:hypothetical protein
MQSPCTAIRRQRKRQWCMILIDTNGMSLHA